MPLTSPLQAPALPQTTKGKRWNWLNLTEGAVPIAIASSAAEHPGFTLVVTADAASAARLADGLEFYRDADEKLRTPVLRFPDWETLPYDNFSPHPEIISGRVRTLHQALHLERGILLLQASQLLLRIAPTQWFHGNSLSLRTGEPYNLEVERKLLLEAGYIAVDIVTRHGEFAVRGSIMDIFPSGLDQPLRVDLFDDQIETLRFFDPKTQKTTKMTESVGMLPAKEFPLDEPAIKTFLDNWYKVIPENPHTSPLYKDLSRGISPAGIEYYLPLFFPETASILDYLEDSAQVIISGPVTKAVDHFQAQVKRRFESLGGNPGRPLLPPRSLLLDSGEVFARLKGMARVTIPDKKLPAGPRQVQFATQPPPALATDIKSAQPLEKLRAFLPSWTGRVLLCVAGPGRKMVMEEMLRDSEITAASFPDFTAFLQAREKVGVVIGPISASAMLLDPEILVLTEDQMYATTEGRRRANQQELDEMIRSLTELTVGSPVVHKKFGVGRYQGMERTSFGGVEVESLVISYADDGKVYAPISSLDQIVPYTGADEEDAPLDHLGGKRWRKAQEKAARQVRDLAADLLRIYAQRETVQSPEVLPPDEDYQLFVREFPFTETPDQQTAIDAVIEDLVSTKPMDRLVCGDVGFGKTEVAMRAAFLTVYGSAQVALIAPTTILAQQHYNNFLDRFASWPATVDLVSRFRSPKEKQKVLEDLKSGKVDIVIGTHALLQKDVKFRNLGLVVVDEEHRFGVAHKETLKKLRTETNILTMTATPIPRTLEQAYSEIKSLSIISTPPAHRMPIQTFVRELEWTLVEDAIQRELLRGGQVYYLHNEVRTIARAAERLGELVPEARIGIAHGQMPQAALGRVMADFYRQRVNVLVCSTIIESGLDVPNANTIIIERADMLGLAQLHQLRGRVGRSHHQAYAWLLTPNPRLLQKNALLRLDAIAAMHELGSGFLLASRDLEIRGAGNLLGSEQSGQIQAVGFGLYMDLLQEAVSAIQENRAPELDPGEWRPEIEIDLRISSLLPETYVDNIRLRLRFYHRLATAHNLAEIREIEAELVDRFGEMPEQSIALMRISALKIKARKLGVKSLNLHARGGRVEFSPKTKVNPLTLVEIVRESPAYRFKDGHTLQLSAELADPEERIKKAESILARLARPPNTG